MALPALLITAVAAQAEVMVRWKQDALPPPDMLGVTALIAAAGSPLAREAAGKGYRVLTEGDLSSRSVKESMWPRIRPNFTIRDGKPVQIASRTAQPWIENNVARIRIRQAAGDRPVLSYPWKPAVSGNTSGPSTDDYARAIAEAGAFGADLVLELDGSALPAWAGARPYLEYYARKIPRRMVANVGVRARDPSGSYLMLNLLARHNVPFRILDSAADTSNLDLVILVDSDAAPPGIAPEGLLRVGDDDADPNAFALKVRNVLGKKRRLVDIWNGITVLTALEEGLDGTLRIELVNYAAQPFPIQVRVRGQYRHVDYARPDASGQATLVVEHLDGFTEFVIPELRIAGTLTLRPN
jgi:hypothetical protein